MYQPLFLVEIRKKEGVISQAGYNLLRGNLQSWSEDKTGLKAHRIPAPGEAWGKNATN